MTEPLGDDGHRHIPKVQRRAARMARIMQPDRMHTRRRRQPVPRVGHRARRVRRAQAAWLQVGQVQSGHAQLLQASAQSGH